MKVILDSGPIIVLSKLGHLHLLPHLFDEVVVPSQVLAEDASPGETRPGAEIRDAPFIRVVAV